MNLTTESNAYWSRELQSLFGALRCGPDGLSIAEASLRLRDYGPNKIEDVRRHSALRLLLRQFASPLVLILVFGAFVSLFVREWVDASIILTVVIGSSMLSFAQEYRASQAISALQQRLALRCRALRDGRMATIAAQDIVPGDIVELSAGNLVPGDGVVVAARDFLVTESALTGESLPVEKQPGIAPENATLQQRTNCVHSGTSVRSGTATVLIVRTGRNTVLGEIALRIGLRMPETDFARGLRRFGYLLLRIMIVIVLSVLTINYLLHRPFVDSLLFAVALAVGLSPELLPAIVSVTLSAGARAMAERGVLVRRLEAIENLGSMDILCTDKTGTLTSGEIVLTDATDVQGRTSDHAHRLAFLNAHFETGIENPLDLAIMEASKQYASSAEDFKKIDEIPYDFVRKRLAIVVQKAGSPTQELIVKGAYENVLSICDAMQRDGQRIPITPEERAGLDAYFSKKGIEGYRVLAVATREFTAKAHYTHDDESNMCFEGFLLFQDPLKPQTPGTVRDLAELGIRIKIITGDNRYVAAHIGQQIGLDTNTLLTGEQLSELRDEALWNLAEKTQIFAEIDPQQKETIVRALQKRGHAVGFLGDGINDAAALHVADVGISVDQAVDVARENADVVLLEPDLDVLRAGVLGGRRTFANTLKYIGISASANFGNMVSMALATPLLPFLPLSAKQILLNNFLSDLPSIAISTDNVDKQAIERPERWDIREVQRFMIVFGVVSSLFDGLTFATLLFVFHTNEALFRTAWFVISVLTQIAAILVLRTRQPAWRSPAGRLLVWLAVAVGLLSAALPFMPIMRELFDFVPLSAGLMAALWAIVAAYVGATEVVKLKIFSRFYRTGNKA